MFKFLSKTAGLVGYVIQYGCLTHCTFEYIGDFVVVIFLIETNFEVMFT